MPSCDSNLPQRQRRLQPHCNKEPASSFNRTGDFQGEEKRVACCATIRNTAAHPAAVRHWPRITWNPTKQNNYSCSSSDAVSSRSFPRAAASGAAALYGCGSRGDSMISDRRPATTMAAAAAAAWLCLLFLCVSPVSIQPAEAVIFELRSGGSQCFYAPVNQAPWSLQGRFESFVGEDTATMTVDGPVPSPDPKLPPPQAKSQMLFSTSRESAPFKLTITIPGMYRLCIMNRVSYTQTVALNFYLLPPAVAAGTSAAPGEAGGSSRDPNGGNSLPPDMSTLVLSTHTDKLRELSNKVVELANALFDQQSTALARVSVYERLNNTTRSRATFWKVLQMGVQVVLSGIQVYAVRSRFEVKTIV